MPTRRQVRAPWSGEVREVEWDPHGPREEDAIWNTENGMLYRGGEDGQGLSLEDYLAQQIPGYLSGQGLYDAGFYGHQPDGSYMAPGNYRSTDPNAAPFRMTGSEWQDFVRRNSADARGYGKGSLGHDWLDSLTDIMPGLIQAAPFALAGAGMGGAFGPGTSLAESLGAAGAAEAAPTFNAGGMSFGPAPSGPGTSSLSDMIAQASAQAPTGGGTGGVNFLETLGTNPGTFPVTGDGTWASSLGPQTYTPGIDVPGVDMSKAFPVSGVNNLASASAGASGAASGVNMMDVLRTGGTVGGLAKDALAPTNDWNKTLSGILPALIGAYGSTQTADVMKDLAAKSRADRAPFLATANSWLSNPQAYAEGPGQAALKGTLAGLSAKFGNPIGSGTALQIATETGARNWQDAVSGMANLGLGGENTQATLGMAGANAGQGMWNALQYGADQVLNPEKNDLASLLKKYKGIFGSGSTGGLG